MWRRVKCRQKYDVCPALVPCACTTLLPLSLSHGLYSLSRGLGPFECPSLPISLPLSSLCLCHSVSVSASLSLSISLSRCSVTLSPSLFHSIAVPISPSLRPSFSAPLSPSLSLCHSVSVPVPFLCLCLGPSPSVCLSPFPVLFYPFKHVQLRNKNSKLILCIYLR